MTSLKVTHTHTHTPSDRADRKPDPCASKQYRSARARRGVAPARLQPPPSSASFTFRHTHVLIYLHAHRRVLTPVHTVHTLCVSGPCTRAVPVGRLSVSYRRNVQIVFRCGSRFVAADDLARSRVTSRERKGQRGWSRDPTVSPTDV